MVPLIQIHQQLPQRLAISPRVLRVALSGSLKQDEQRAGGLYRGGLTLGCDIGGVADDRRYVYVENFANLFREGVVRLVLAVTATFTGAGAYAGALERGVGARTGGGRGF